MRTNSHRGYHVPFERYLTNLYGNLNMKLKHKGHPTPTYTKEELGVWLKSQPNFKKLWDDWTAYDYDSKLRPRIKRLDDRKGYSLDNIKLTRINAIPNKRIYG
jgi:hypothetical protein